MILIIALAFFACDDKGDTHTHEWGAWQYNATEHWKECTANDGAKTDIAPHTAGDWIIDNQATYDTDGSRHKKCTVCEYIIETETIAKFKTEQPFTIGSVNFIFEYRRDDTVSWGKLEPTVQNYIEYISNPPNAATQHNTNIVSLSGREGAAFRIIVDYSDAGKDAGFVATDGQTLTIGSEYLATATINRNTLRDAFGAMLAKPWPISPHTHEWGDWQYNETEHWKECSCGEKTDVGNHEWEWEETTPATYDTEGEETRTCNTCGATETQAIAKFKTEQPFTIGSVNFIFEYRRDDTVSWAKFNAVVQLYKDYIATNTDSTEMELITRLSNRIGAEYRIIVDYSDEGKEAGFTATNGQTATVGNEYLATANLIRGRLREAFQAILDKPWPIVAQKCLTPNKKTHSVAE